MLRCLALLLCCAMPALAVEKPQDPSADPDVTYRFPLISAPKMAAAPTIDGEVDKAEWSGAAQSAPLVLWRGDNPGAITDDPAVYWIGYTDDALQLAFRFARPAYAVEPKSVGEHDHVWGGDIMEVLMRHAFGDTSEYNFVINPAGTRGEGFRTANNNPGWTKPWTGATRVTETGWEGECSIPFTTLETQTPARGDMWEILLLRNRKTPTNAVALNSFIHAWGAADPEFGYLRIGDTATPAVRVIEAGPVGARQAGLTLELIGGAEPRNLIVETSIRTARQGAALTAAVNERLGDGEVLVPREEELTFPDAMERLGAAAALGAFDIAAAVEETVALPANQTLRFPLSADVPYGKHVMLYRVRDAETNELIAGGSAPFVQSPLFEVDVELYLLVAKGLKVTADYRRMSEANDRTQLVAELIDPATGDVAQTVTQPIDVRAGRGSVMLPVTERFDRSWRVRTSLQTPSGALVEDVQTVELPSKPDWLDNNIGITDDPLPGWTPIALDGDHADVVLRRYTLGDSGLPSQIVSRGEALLTGPVKLAIGDDELAWSRKLTSQSDGKVVWESTAQTSGIDLSMRTTMEYDGMVRYDLTLSPRGDSAALRDMELRVPYNLAFARFRKFQGGRNYDVTDGKVYDFAPLVELGDFEKGLTWFAEWDRHWTVGEQPYYEMTENGASLDLLVRMIGSGGKTLTEPVTITFGMQALPVREIDWTLHYERRRVYGGAYPTPPTHPSDKNTIEDVSECDLRYPLAGHVAAEQGAIALRAALGIRTRVLRIGEGEDAVCLGYGRVRWNKYAHALYLWTDANEPGWENDWNAKTVFGKLNDLTHPSAWVPIVLSWRRDGDVARLTLMTVDANHRTLRAVTTLPYDRWRKAIEGGQLTIGGEGTMAVDHVLMTDQAIEDALILGLIRSADVLHDALTLNDPCQRMRMYRGNFITLPIKGAGGVAGSKYMGVLVEQIEGQHGKAVLVPSNEQFDGWAMLRGLKVGTVFPIFEQWHQIMGYYGKNFVPHPVHERHYQQVARRLDHGTMLYANFGFSMEEDEDIAPFMDELSSKPVGRVYTAIYPNLATPAADYYIWGWKQTIDRYGVKSLHMDNTLNCRRPSFDPAIGFGFYDEQGNEHPRWFLFGARELAKRFRWLFHVYQDDGLLCLGHGARQYPLVAGFVDLTQSGEGGFYYNSTWETLMPPEDYPENTAHRFGIPHETLTKPGSQHAFSPNFTFMYMLMQNGSMRTMSAHLRPQMWHVNADAAAHSYYRIDEFNPYFAQSGVGWVASPFVLWWMLQDEFEMRSASFVPFWRADEWLALSPDDLRASMWLHEGKDAIICAANFSGEPVDAQVKIDLAKCGLTNLDLDAYDAFTYEDYVIEGDTVTLTVPATSYRLIRVEQR